jgi:hypothetical protein
MEKNMIAVASEIEKLRGDLANAEKRATAVTATAPVANPGFPTTYGNSEATYPAPAAYGNSETTYAPTYGNTEAAYASTYGSSEAAYAAAYGNSDAYSTNQVGYIPLSLFSCFISGVKYIFLLSLLCMSKDTHSRTEIHYYLNRCILVSSLNICSSFYFTVGLEMIRCAMYCF